ncbi:leucine carboxyl methyltransferase 1 [Aaosphaeria arxii CBS 175.79]|uniref:Leucine carboxyl methyltransferase 1 n=1 Tax=Aaosphaeria arxii CBS 175.79 TaxID=1450172 RepID=A0A6A5XHG8_9PLEO|nr:leucine carboxyl methyltransferase 1 [Aaosphaeria arxii CBS 175.79]KAF2012329.1 leucine carboxyl methyltransferase 1 [Aaosphaeria arxii CBS 175.79]
MSGQEIPDLRTLLGSRRGGPSRGRARGRGGFGSSHEGREALKDEAVRNTDQDAAGSRVSCVELGYLHDPYAKLFATQPATRRLPLLNRGSYVRTSAIDDLVDRFMNASTGPKQIISLGAGTDTRYFRLRDRYPDLQLVYHEIDFATNTAAKLTSIQRHPQLHSKLTSRSAPNPLALPPAATTYHSSTYNVHALDLRTLAASSEENTLPTLPNIDPTLPTLLLSEMCLVYLPAPTVSSILSSFLQKYIPEPTPVSLILYEPILPNDAFGRTMISNLSTRNIHLPTLLAYPELSDQRARLQQYGFHQGAHVADTASIWRAWVTDEEKERVAALEMLDELEELDLLLRHYCVAWGWRDSGSEGVFTKAWADIKEQ